MAYEINIGGCALYGILSVEESTVRGVVEHDGVGSGAFAVVQNVKLTHWSIRLELTQKNQGQAGWRPADKVINELSRQLKRQSGVRLVIVSDGQRLSDTVLLLEVKRETNYQGVYPVALSLIEYIGPRVKTEAIPSIPRPGVPPKAPEVVKVKVVYETLWRKQTFEVPDSSTIYRPVDPDNGKPVNLAGLQSDEIVRVIKEDANSAFITEQQKEQAAITGVMNSAHDDFINSMGSE